MAKLLVKYETSLILLFLGGGIFFLIQIKTLEFYGFLEAIKWLAVPIALLVFGFTYKNFQYLAVRNGDKQTNPWWGALLYYLGLLVFSWPYVLAANAIAGNENLTIISGSIEQKVADKTRGGGLRYLIKIREEKSGILVTQEINEEKYHSVIEGENYSYCFYQGRFGIPYHWREDPPPNCPFKEKYSANIQGFK